MQQTSGEDVATLGVRAELNLVYRQEIDLPVEWHRLDRADEIRRVGRQDLLFACDQSHRARASELDHPVIIFASEQPQRKADHAAAMAEHPFDREMGLAGIRRPKDREEPRSGAEHSHTFRYRMQSAPGQEETDRKLHPVALHRYSSRDRQTGFGGGEAIVGPYRQRAPQM